MVGCDSVAANLCLSPFTGGCACACGFSQRIPGGAAHQNLAAGACPLKKRIAAQARSTDRVIRITAERCPLGRPAPSRHVAPQRLSLSLRVTPRFRSVSARPISKITTAGPRVKRAQLRWPHFFTHSRCCLWMCLALRQLARYCGNAQCTQSLATVE